MAKFLYRDGANYKFTFSSTIRKFMEVGEETTYEKLGYNKENFFNNVVGYPPNEDDHNIVSLLAYESSDLPEGYFDIIEKHLPNYSRRDDVLHNDILCRAHRGEEYEDADLRRLLAEGETVEQAYLKTSLKLYYEAINVYLSRYVKVNIPNNEKSVCASCGKCCQWHPGIYHPDQFDKVTTELIVSLLRNGAVVNYWEGDFEGADGKIGYFIQPGVTDSGDRVIHAMWGGRCKHLSDLGCTKSFDERPRECQALIPDEKEPHEGCSVKDDKYLGKNAYVKAWLPYNEMIEEAINIVTSERGL